MKIGVDFDGTITKNKWYKEKTNLPWWLIFIGVITLWPFIWPKREIVDALRRWAKNNDEIIIISAKPKELKELTEIWLFQYKVPFDQLVLVGTGEGVEERKLKAIQELGVEFYLDDDLTTVNFIRRNGVSVRAHHFK